MVQVFVFIHGAERCTLYLVFELPDWEIFFKYIIIPHVLTEDFTSHQQFAGLVGWCEAASRGGAWEREKEAQQIGALVHICIVYAPITTIFRVRCLLGGLVAKKRQVSPRDGESFGTPSIICVPFWLREQITIGACAVGKIGQPVYLLAHVIQRFGELKRTNVRLEVEGGLK